jgi:hypothetical protein
MGRGEEGYSEDPYLCSQIARNIVQTMQGYDVSGKENVVTTFTNFPGQIEPAGGLNWDLGENTNIVTTLTDNYGSIFVTRADKNDPYMPGSWLVYITPSAGMNFTATREWKEWYYVRINQMKAPFVAGRYFFKIFLSDHYPVRSSTTSTLINSTMPMENWPVLLVKGETDPGIIWGTVRYGDMGNQDLYGLPMSLPGRVRAVGYANRYQKEG